MKDYLTTVKSNEEINDGILKLTLESKEPFDLGSFRGGQFAHLEVPDGASLLRRPFGIYEITQHTVTFLIAKKGAGTDSLFKAKIGTELKVILSLGNGFKLEESDKRVVLLGAGMGAAPLYPVMSTYPNKEYFTFLGFRDKTKVMCVEDFSTKSKTVVCTDDGSYGNKGFPTDYLKAGLDEIKPDVILICGPHPFMKIAQRIAIDNGIKAYLSTEQRMGCGIGACLVCSCKTVKNGEEHMSRVCADGPVFDVKEIVL